MKKAVLLAGEKSGDLIGGELCYYLKNAGFEIYGVGGEAMLQNGLNSSFFPISEISVMGFAEVLPKIFSIKKRIKQTAKQILEINPDFVLTIDAPGFNTRVVKKIKGRFKGKIFHAVAPTVWAYKEGRAKTFAKLYDELFCILPFEPPYFTKVGLKATYICYPPLNRLKEQIEDASNYKKEYILFALGSRKVEVLHHLEFAKEVVHKIKEKIPDAVFVFPTFTEFEEEIKNAFPNEIVSSKDEEKALFFKKAKFAISKSGTGAVEVSFFSIPCVVFYKVNLISFFIIKLLAKIKFVHLINIMLDKEIIPEFIQFDATPQKVAEKSIYLLTNDEAKNNQIKEVAKAKQLFLNSNYTSFAEGVYKNIIKNL